MKVDIDYLAKAIVKELEKYTTEVEIELQEEKEKIAKETVRNVKNDSPKREGKYAASWGTEKDDKTIIVRNKKHYQRTHLLEKGHAKRGGGRVPGITHIASAEEKAVKNFTEAAERIVGK